MLCPACNLEISSSATRCPYCTSKLVKYKGVRKKSFSVALFGGVVFSLTFGFFGFFLNAALDAAIVGFFVGFINAWFVGLSGTRAE